LPNDRAAVVVWLDLELEPCTTGHLHLGDEPEQSILFEALDTPEVDRVAHLYFDGVTTADEHVAPVTVRPWLGAIFDYRARQIEASLR
jgi:hypothetical protein